MVRISILSKLLSQDYMKLKFLELWNDLQNDNCYQNPVGACKWNYFSWKLHQMALFWGLIMSGEYSLTKIYDFTFDNSRWRYQYLSFDQDTRKCVVHEISIQ